MPGFLSDRKRRKAVTQKQKGKGYIYILILMLAGTAAFAVRWAGMEYIAGDMRTCLLPWSAAMKTGQGVSILLDYDGDYNMPYITVLWLLNYLPGSTIVKIKLFSVLFEYLGAVVAGLIAAHFVEERKKWSCFTAVCAAVMFYPSAVLNGAWWGQCDFIYVAFLLYMIWALLKEHYGAATILFGCALSFKLQSVLILPILLIFWWKKRSFSGLYFLLTAVAMEVLCIPAILGGYSLLSPFLVYMRQLGRYPYMYVFYPNFWALFREAPYYIFSGVAIIGILAGLGIFSVAVIRKRREITGVQWIEFATWSVFFMMCFLPCMHERYGMLAEILAVIYAFLNRRAWWNAVIIGAGSCITYLQVTFGKNILPDQWIAAAYLLSLGFFTWQMIRNWDREESEKKSAYSLQKSRKKITAIEVKVMEFTDRHILTLAFAILTILAIFVRKPMIECMSADYLSNLIEIEGNFHTPLYMFLMRTLSFIQNTLLPDKTLFFLVKMLCLASDIFAAAMVALCIYDCKIKKAVKEGESGGKGESDRKLLAVIVYGALLFLPMVLLNSPVWMHLDGISIGLLAGGHLLYTRKKDIAAGVLAGIACGFLAHYVVCLSIISGIKWLIAGRKNRAEVQKRQKRFENVCVVTMVLSCATGLICGYSIWQCLYKLLCFWLNFETWMLYPLLVLALIMCFYHKNWIPVWVLLEVAVILDWGEFLYELPVLPHAIYILLYLTAGVWAGAVIGADIKKGSKYAEE